MDHKDNTRRIHLTHLFAHQHDISNHSSYPYSPAIHTITNVGRHRSMVGYSRSGQGKYWDGCEEMLGGVVRILGKVRVGRRGWWRQGQDLPGVKGRLSVQGLQEACGRWGGNHRERQGRQKGDDANDAYQDEQIRICMVCTRSTVEWPVRVIDVLSLPQLPNLTFLSFRALILCSHIGLVSRPISFRHTCTSTDQHSTRHITYYFSSQDMGNNDWLFRVG